jgi:hypothetical protein
MLLWLMNLEFGGSEVSAATPVVSIMLAHGLYVGSQA